MLWWIGGIVVALVAAQAAALFAQGRYRHFDKSALAVQGLATTLAILFAGYWYVYERKGQPQANTRLEVVGVRLSPEAVALEARFTISNMGATLLRIGGSDVRLQRIGAEGFPVDALLERGRDDFPDMVDGMDAYDDGLLMWPTVKWYRGGRERHIEPGETDLRAVDFVARCDDRAFRVLFMMDRPGTDQVWSDQATVSLVDLCSKRVGGREVWTNAKD